MPSFYPSNAGSARTANVPGHGNGYKDACYQDMTDFPPHYQDYQQQGDHSHEFGPVLPNPFDRYAKMPSVMPPAQPYGFPYLDGNQNGYMAPTMNPMLPPHDQQYYGNGNGNVQEQPRRQANYVPPRDEKPLGGVAATLDYEMEQMTDFVAETAFGLYELCASRLCIEDIDLLRSIRPGFALPSSFRKWVSQVLHATRLPSPTILLSLAFLAQRARQSTAAGMFDPSEPALYSSLTVALILGSKFLDDNTFQNKSWAEVSQISVADLNKDERDWLIAFDHRLHQTPSCSDGYKSCEQLWSSFQSRKPASTAVPAASHNTALQPINTNLRSRQYSRHQSPHDYRHGKLGLSSFAVDPTLADPHYQAFLYPSLDIVHSHSASPASAQTTGPHTPEYYGGHHAGWGVSDPYGRQDYGYYLPDPFSTMPHGYNARSQGYGYGAASMMQGQNFWNCHGVACQCHNCRQSHFLPRYGPMVAG